MKKILLLLIVFAFVSNAQFRRIALLEEATNASCSPCAQNNPNLQEFVEKSFGGVITVRYHAWWPGSDPMYSLNPTENRARIEYYGINGVPGYTMDGVFKGVPGNPETMRAQMDADLRQGSPLWINIERTESSDSVIFDVQVIVGEDVNGALKLRNAIIERRKVYPTPPGSNGERIFNDVFRKMLPNTDGENLGNLTAGDTLNFSYAYPIEDAWNATDLAVVSWVQNDNDKNVIQANIDFPTIYTKCDKPFAEIVSSGGTITKTFSVMNSNPDTMHIQLTFEADLPSDWSVNYDIPDSIMNGDVATLSPFDSLVFSMTVNIGEEAGLGKIIVFPRNADDPYLYGYAVNNFEFLPNGNVLLVDADGGKHYEVYYQVAFNQIEMDYSMLDRGLITILGAQLLEYDWDAIYWNTAWGFPAFVPDEIDFLTNYLDNGGNLFIAGQDIGWDIFDPSGTSRFPEASDFYQTYLGATYLADDAGSYSINGVAGDPITDGLSFSVSAIHQRYPESIRPRGSGSSIILKYANGKNAAVKNEIDNYKTVYLGIGLEQVSTETARIALVQKSLEWFGVITDVNDEAETLPKKFALSQNYPNPFNPTTTISYSIPNSSVKAGNQSAVNVALTVYNALGEKVATLVNKAQAPGNYTVQFKATNLPSGIYFYTLNAGNFTQTKKMILLK